MQHPRTCILESPQPILRRKGTPMLDSSLMHWGLEKEIKPFKTDCCTCVPFLICGTLRRLSNVIIRIEMKRTFFPYFQCMIIPGMPDGITSGFFPGLCGRTSYQSYSTIKSRFSPLALWFHKVSRAGCSLRSCQVTSTIVRLFL